MDDMFMSLFRNRDNQSNGDDASSSDSRFNLRGMLPRLGNVGDLLSGAAANPLSGILQRIGSEGDSLLSGLRNGSLFSRLGNMPIFG